MSLQEFYIVMDDMVFEMVFYEQEINWEVRVFGNIVYVWSIYEMKLEKNGKVE